MYIGNYFKEKTNHSIKIFSTDIHKRTSIFINANIELFAINYNIVKYNNILCVGVLQIYISELSFLKKCQFTSFKY